MSEQLYTPQDVEDIAAATLVPEFWYRVGRLILSPDKIFGIGGGRDDLTPYKVTSVDDKGCVEINSLNEDNENLTLDTLEVRAAGKYNINRITGGKVVAAVLVVGAASLWVLKYNKNNS